MATKGLGANPPEPFLTELREVMEAAEQGEILRIERRSRFEVETDVQP